MLLLEVLLVFLQALDLLLQSISFSNMLSVCIIELVPHTEKLIPSLGDQSILLCEKISVVQSLIQSIGFQERPIGNILQ